MHRDLRWDAIFRKAGKSEVIGASQISRAAVISRCADAGGIDRSSRSATKPTSTSKSCCVTPLSRDRSAARRLSLVDVNEVAARIISTLPEKTFKSFNTEHTAADCGSQRLGGQILARNGQNSHISNRPEGGQIDRET